MSGAGRASHWLGLRRAENTESQSQIWQHLKASRVSVVGSGRQFMAPTLGHPALGPPPCWPVPSPKTNHPQKGGGGRRRPNFWSTFSELCPCSFLPRPGAQDGIKRNRANSGSFGRARFLHEPWVYSLRTDLLSFHLPLFSTSWWKGAQHVMFL